MTSWKRIRNISVEYPTDFRGEVAQFADALEDNQMREKIQRGRAEAKRLRARYSIPDQLGGGFGKEPTECVGWTGRPLVVPEMGVLGRMRH